MSSLQASTVSQTDCLIREGRGVGKTSVTLPTSPGVDVLGKIYRIDTESAKTYGLAVGDRVMTLTKFGGNSRYLAVSPNQLVRVPETVDPAETVCLAETYLIAFQALHHNQSYGQRYRKTSLKGKSILFVGALTSNMCRALAQLSSLAAVENVYATAKSKHFQKFASLGILPLGQDPLEWFERLKGRLDMIVSIDEDVTPLHYKLLNPKGEVLIVSMSSLISPHDLESIAGSERFDRQPGLVCSKGVWQNRSRTHAYDLYTEWEEKLDRCKSDLAFLVKLMDERKINPHVLDRIPLSKVARAQELIEAKNVHGFIVCEPWLVSKCRALRI